MDDDAAMSCDRDGCGARGFARRRQAQRVSRQPIAGVRWCGSPITALARVACRAWRAARPALCHREPARRGTSIGVKAAAALPAAATIC